jgi:hypothetical protein
MKRTAGIAATLLVALTMTAAPVLGAGQSGNVGRHKVIDRDGAPGVTCVYPEPVTNDFIKRIKVRAPNVFAYDRTAGVDHQWVGWRYLIDYAATGNPQPGDWQNVVTSTVAKATATDDHKAAFADRTYVFPTWSNSGAYRVRLQIRWYYPGQVQVDGKLSQPLLHYLQHLVGAQDYVPPFAHCEGNLG